MEWALNSLVLTKSRLNSWFRKLKNGSMGVRLKREDQTIKVVDRRLVSKTMVIIVR